MSSPQTSDTPSQNPRTFPQCFGVRWLEDLMNSRPDPNLKRLSTPCRLQAQPSSSSFFWLEAFCGFLLGATRLRTALFSSYSQRTKFLHICMGAKISFSCRRSESLCRVQGLRLLGLEICRGSLLIVIDVFAGICISCKALRMNPFGIGVRCKSFWHRLACVPADC